MTHMSEWGDMNTRWLQQTLSGQGMTKQSLLTEAAKVLSSETWQF